VPGDPCPEREQILGRALEVMDVEHDGEVTLERRADRGLHARHAPPVDIGGPLDR
jgi:hypothetical protein